MKETSSQSSIEGFVQVEDIVDRADTEAMKEEVNIQEIVSEIKSLKVRVEATEASIEAPKEPPSVDKSLEGEKIFSWEPFALPNDCYNEGQCLSTSKLEQRLSSLEATALGIKTALADIHEASLESDKMRRIEFALANAKAYQVPHVLNFRSGRSSVPFNLANFVTFTLFCFRKGHGNYIPNDVLFWDNTKKLILATQEEREAAHLAFHDRILDHFYCLLGSKPRIDQDGDGNNVIYYDP